VAKSKERLFIVLLGLQNSCSAGSFFLQGRKENLVIFNNKNIKLKESSHD